LQQALDRSESNPSSSRPERAISRAVAVFFIAFFLLFSGGRLGSADAGAVLQASMMWVTQGIPGTLDVSEVEDPGLWVQAPSGRWYEAHDLGGAALMLPAAAIGARLGRGDTVRAPPPIARVTASLTHALLCAAGAFFAYRLFRTGVAPRAAFLLAVAFVVTTPFWPYSKTLWDVTGALVGLSFALWQGARLAVAAEASQRVPRWAAPGFGLGLAFACTFRFSLTPFAALGALVFAWLLARRGKPPAAVVRTVAIGAMVFVLGLIPSLLYNAVRTGAFWIPATRDPKFAITNDLGGDLLTGLWGLWISPNRGLFIYAPVFLLLGFAPVAWRRMPCAWRSLSVAFLPATAGYVLMIAKLRSWGSFGWGPRYLVPVLIVLFLPVAGVLVTTARSSWRGRVCGVLVVLSLALNLAPAVTNWSLAIAAPGVALQDAPSPRAHAAVWSALLRGLRGEALEVHAGDDPLRAAGARFPDLWTVRLLELGGAPRAAGATALVTLLISLASSVLLFRRFTYENAAGSHDRGGCL
jgi:hypothetical protein